MPIPKIIKTNNNARPSNLKAISIPKVGIQAKVSRITWPEKMSEAKPIAMIRAEIGINNVKLVDWLRVNLPVMEDIILPIKDSKCIQSKVIDKPYI
jgi:hypothetical protein